jgi:hypothetical protein
LIDGSSEFMIELLMVDVKVMGYEGTGLNVMVAGVSTMVSWE